MLLAALMLLGVWMPALAAGDTAPLWQKWGYASKEDFCQHVMDDYGGGPLTEDEYVQMEAFYEENLEIFRDQMESEWEFEGYESKEAYLAAMGYTDEAVYLHECAVSLSQIQLMYYREEMAAQAQYRKQLGMTWDGVNVQVNGSYLRFHTAYPEYSEGSLMVPLGPLASALGTAASTTGDGGVSLRYGSRTAAFVMGQSTITAVASDGSRWPSELPAAPYPKNGDIYVPVRALGNALGLLVFYDREYDCVVLVDKQRAIDQIDARFTVLNDLPDFAPAIDPEKTYRTELSGTVKITEFDTIEGDGIYPVSGKLTVIHQGVNMHCDVVLDLSSLMELLKKSLLGLYVNEGADEVYESDYVDEEGEARWAELKSAMRALRTIDYEMIVNQDEDVIYIKSVALVQLMQSLELELPGGPLDGSHTWFKITGVELEDLNLPESGGLMESRQSVGEELFERVFEEVGIHYQSCGAFGYYEPYGTCLLYGELEELAGALEALVGDSRFTRQGQADTVEFDLAKLDGDQATAIQYAFDLGELRGKLSIDKAAKRVTGNVRIRGDDRYSYGYSDALMQAAFDLAPNQLEVTAEYHEKNKMKVELRLSGSSAETTESVPTAPPAGDLIIDEEQLESLKAA